MEADLDIAAGHHTQSRETLEEEWAERQRQQNLVWHARERDLKVATVCVCVCVCVPPALLRY